MIDISEEPCLMCGCTTAVWLDDIVDTDDCEGCDSKVCSNCGEDV